MSDRVGLDHHFKTVHAYSVAALVDREAWTLLAENNVAFGAVYAAFLVNCGGLRSTFAQHLV